MGALVSNNVIANVDVNSIDVNVVEFPREIILEESNLETSVEASPMTEIIEEEQSATRSSAQHEEVMVTQQTQGN
jgi:hypothetical protein